MSCCFCLKPQRASILCLCPPGTTHGLVPTSKGWIFRCFWRGWPNACWYLPAAKWGKPGRWDRSCRGSCLQQRVAPERIGPSCGQSGRTCPPPEASVSGLGGEGRVITTTEEESLLPFECGKAAKPLRPPTKGRGEGWAVLHSQSFQTCRGHVSPAPWNCSPNRKLQL